MHNAAPRKPLKWRMLRWASVALLGLGMLIVVASYRYLSPNRWSPVNGPVPGANLTVAFPFTVRFPGSYAFELCKPITENVGALPLPPLPPLSCHLRMTISNDKGWRISRDILSLHHTSRYEFGHTDYYEDESFSIPDRGNYVLEMTSIGAAPFLTSGASFSLARKENAADTMVFAGLGRTAGVCALGVGSIGLLCSFGVPRRIPSAAKQDANAASQR